MPPKSIAKGRVAKPASKPPRSKNPKDSHLYTDDNPATTIHGTGFKDKATALRTMDLIKNRSLTYQFQTVNTMYYRAKHHPSMKNRVEGSAKTSDMDAAMEIFRHWLDVTYPAERDGARAGGFKPLLSKGCVERHLPSIEAEDGLDENAKRFATFYAALPKGKRLANVLVNDKKPMEADWERLRYDSLLCLVPEGKVTASEWSREELWADAGKVSRIHLSLIAWAWSPLSERKLS